MHLRSSLSIPAPSVPTWTFLSSLQDTQSPVLTWELWLCSRPWHRRVTLFHVQAANVAFVFFLSLTPALLYPHRNICAGFTLSTPPTLDSDQLFPRCPPHHADDSPPRRMHTPYHPALDCRLPLPAPASLPSQLLLEGAGTHGENVKSQKFIMLTSNGHLHQLVILPVGSCPMAFFDDPPLLGLNVHVSTTAPLFLEGVLASYFLERNQSAALGFLITLLTKTHVFKNFF